MDYFDEINEAGCCFLTKLEEAGGNSLSLSIQTSKVSEREEKIFIDEKQFGKGKRIYSDDTCPEFQIYFERFIAFNVLNESYLGSDEGEYTGKYLRVYSKSKYIDFLTEYASVYLHEGEVLTHYAFLCQDQVIDIVSTRKPTIIQIN